MAPNRDSLELSGEIATPGVSADQTNAVNKDVGTENVNVRNQIESVIKNGAASKADVAGMIDRAAPVEQEVCLGSRLVVNEVALRGGPPFAILRIDLLIDGELVTTYHGDGLIISTPVGSTAHNLSTGGPILRKDLEAVVISPMTPHTLSFRPVVDSANRIYEFRVLNREGYVVIDGDSSMMILPGDRAEIKRSQYSFKMVRIPGRSHYRTLREKLGWSGRIEHLTGRPSCDQDCSCSRLE